MTGSDHPRRLAALPALALAVTACSPGPSAPPAVTASAPPVISTAAATPAASSSPTALPSPAASPSPTASPSPGESTSPTPEPTPGSAIVAGTVDKSSLEVYATYDVDLDIAVGTGVIAVEAVIGARNDSGTAIDRLELNTVAARLGGLRLTEASVDGRTVDVTIDDQTLLVPFGGILPDGASTTVRLGYTATLRPNLDGSNWLFSRAGGTLALYRWVPWVSRALPFDRPNYGDPFVTPSSPLVSVRVTTDAPMVLASPGVDAAADRRRNWSLELRDVRDVALVLAPDFRVATGEADGIAVRAFTRPDGLDGDRLVAQAVSALTKMADRLDVAYPWPAFTVIETRGGYGMESPGSIWIPSRSASANIPYLVRHETAHQWFYGLVGSDQQAEPFADEAAADLLARTVLGALRGSRCAPAPLDRAIPRYSRACYYEIVYIQGGNLLDDVRESMGTARFWATLRDYLGSNRFGLAGTRQLLDTLRAASPVDLLPILRTRFPSLY